MQFGQNIVTEVAQRAEQTWNYSVKVFEGVYLSGLTIPFGDGGQVSLLALLITTTVESFVSGPRFVKGCSEAVDVVWSDFIWGQLQGTTSIGGIGGRGGWVVV